MKDFLVTRAYRFLWILEVFSLSAFLWHALVPEPFSRTGLPLALSFAGFAALGLALGFGLSKVARSYALFLSSKTEEPSSNLLRAIILSLTPCLVFSLIFLPYLVFLKDFRPLLLPVVLAGTGFLQLVFLARLRESHPGRILPDWKRVTSISERLSPKAIALVLFGAALLVYILLLTGWVVPAQPLTGDEPHYLLISKSLLKDGDINLFNNYQNKDYLEYYPGPLYVHAYPGKKGREFLYSQHFPGLSVLVLPFFYLGEKLGTIAFMARLPLSVLAAILGSLIFLFARDLTKNSAASLTAWALVCFTSPLLFYAQLIYSELPVSLILLAVSYFVLYKKNFSLAALFLSGFGLALIPWFGLKYAVLGAVIFLMVVVLWLKSRQRNLLRACAFLTPLIVSFGLFLYFLWLLHGNFSPTSVYQWPPRSSFFKWNFLDIVRRIIGYGLDQRAGIFIYSPVLILLIPGIFLLARTAKKESIPILLTAGLWGAFLVSSSEYWGGFSPPGRPLLPVEWALAICIAAALARRRNRSSIAVSRALILLSLLAAFLCVQNPRLLYHENMAGIPGKQGLTSNLLASISNNFVDWTRFVPALSNVNPADRLWRPLIFWLPAILVLTFFFLAGKHPKKRAAPLPLAVHAGYVLFLSAALSGYAFLHFRLDRPASFQDKGYTIFFQDDNHFEKELEGFWTKGNARATILLQAPRRLEEIDLDFSSPVPGKVTAALGRKKTLLASGEGAGSLKHWSVRSPVGCPWSGGYLYFIQVRADHPFVPFELDRRSADGRRLGVFVRIEIRFSDS